MPEHTWRQLSPQEWCQQRCAPPPPPPDGSVAGVVFVVLLMGLLAGCLFLVIRIFE